MRRLRLLFVLGVWSFAGCAGEDKAPARPSGPSLGQEIFGVLCDRVGAQALHEDLTGGSYHDVCHGTASTVDSSKLAPAPDATLRATNIAKVEALARHKSDIIAALETVFPDDIVVGKNLDAADPTASCDPVSSKTRRDQLRGLLTRLLPKDDELVPESSRSAARSIEPLTTAEGKSARDALTHIAARRGYMPPELATGLLGSVLTAPRLRDMLGTTMKLLGPDASPYDAPGTKGTGYGAFKKVIEAVQDDMRETVAQEAPLTFSTDAAGRPILSRPRTTLELARAVLLTEHPVFTNGEPLWVAKRDYRGMAAVAKGENGKLPAPFVDSDGDGLPDLDALGRFKGGAPDPFVGNEKNPLYEYIDARSTAASALVRHIAPLADPDNGNEAILNAAEGLEPLLREREALLDLVHAGGQLSADPGTDDALALLGQLFEKEPQLMARVTGNLLDAKAILDAHPEAKIPDGSSLFDDILDVMLKWSAEPGLMEDVLTSMADSRSLFIQQAIPAQLLYRDRMTYDPGALNGLPINLTAGKGASAPETLVDRAKPNVGWNRSIFQRFLNLLADTNGVTFCNKDQAVLHGVIQLADGEYHQIDLPLEGPAPECGLLKIDNLSIFYLRSMIGKAPLQFRPAFFNPEEPKPPVLTAEVLRRSTGIDGFWDSKTDGRDPRSVYPRPEFLNRQVFYQIDPNLVCGEANKYTTPCVLKDLQGMHIPSSVCASRTIDDPLAGDDTVIDKPPVGARVSGLRTCSDGQYMDQRNPDTLFALEYNHGYEAFAPLVEVFVNHKKEQLLIDLMIALNKHWSVQGGVAAVEPALAEILKTDIIPSLGKLGKVTNGMKVERCIASGANDCAKKESVAAVKVLAEGMRAMIDPARATAAGVTDRRGATKTKSGKPLTIMGLLRDALSAEEAVVGKDKARENKWRTARSRIVDEFLSIDGRGDAAKFKDAGVSQIAPVIIELVRAQRLAKCKGDTACPALRKDLAVDVEKTLKGKIMGSGLDLLDVILDDSEMRGELGRMTSYLFRDDGALGGATNLSASSTPFGGKARGPGALDHSIAALVDALGAMGDLKDVRAMAPFLARSLDEIDPQLSLLSRLNARAFDANGNEICSRELDPEEAIRGMLARLTLPVRVPGKADRPALQIFMDALADVHRVDASNTGPLAPDDYTNVFKNVHDLLTDPESGLEQLYASVKNATER